MLQYDMTAQVRETFGKGAARTLRRDGQTPAVLYGPQKDVVALQMETRPFTKTLVGIQRRNAVINLAIEGGKKKESRHVMIKEVQTDPINNALIHADFYEISLKTPMTLLVPVKYTGKAVGVDLGGEMEIAVKELPMKGLVLDFPDVLELDVTSLNVGDRLTCKDITIPANMTLEKSEDTVCVSVMVASLKQEIDEGMPEAETAVPASEEGASSEASSEE
jgi:large subunit ribosomal protein L25